MPELPEVEVTRRGVDAAFVGQVLQSCTIRQPKLRWPVPAAIKHLVGCALSATDRRSKYLVMQFSGKPGDGDVIVHLGMSGALQIVPKNSPWKLHEHIEWEFETGALRLHDPRRFGSVELVEKGLPWQQYKRLKALGVEPFDEVFTWELLFKATRGKKLSIKALLLSGAVVVGVGNIYASESLFRAGIRPGRAAGRLSKVDCARLADAIRDVLAEAIERGGSSLRDFIGTDGTLGHFQLHADVYGREGQPCKRCVSPIKRIVQGQRSSFYCVRCQS